MQPFIAQDSWVINSSPYIRSIPENKLNGAGATGQAFGGTAFSALNLTIGMPVWGKALVPASIVGDPQFTAALSSAENTAHTALTLLHEKDDPGFKAFIAQLPSLGAKLADAKTFLSGLPSEPQIASTKATADALNKTNAAIRLLNTIESSEPMEAPALFSGSTSRLSHLIVSLGALAASLDGDPKARTVGIQEGLRTLQSSLSDQFAKIDQSVAAKEATNDLASVKPILNTILNEMNLTAISPVLFFDCARLWPDRAQFHYAPGAGVRLSLVTLNLTVGYARNVGEKQRRALERSYSA